MSRFKPSRKLSGLILFLIVIILALSFPNHVSAEVEVSSDASNSEATTDHVVPPDLKVLSEDEIKAVPSESYKFEAEVNRMMKMIINSLYKVKEVFLREVISNASDALDKIRFLSLTDKEVLGDTPELKITVIPDPEKKTLTIRDYGIGMTKQDLVKNLGTIAKSGTSEFLSQMENNSTSDMGLIGQFGVGFYSVFLVADKVTVVSKNPKDKQYVWQSDAINDFTIIEDPRGNTLGRGTEITLHLKDSELEYVDDQRLKDLIKKYSEFINFEIYLWSKQTREEEVIDEEATAEQDKKADDLEVEDVEEEKKESKPMTKIITHHFHDWELMNHKKPLWTRDPKTITEQEYKDFYPILTKEKVEPLAWSHFKAEGDVNFNALVYIPEFVHADYYQKMEEHLKNMKLFVRRVFISDEMLQLLPKYLSFIRGLVDSDDLPLNVSRETLQQNSLVKIIRKKVVGKVLEMIKKLQSDDRKYKKFIKEFGIALKLGVIEDRANREKLAKLIRFQSSAAVKTTDITGFEDYVSRMKKGQPQIYYLTGTSLEEIKSSPFVEKLLARGYEVLYMAEPIDEYFLEHYKRYQNYPLQNVAKAGVLYGDEDEDSAKKEKEVAEEFKPLTDWLKTALSEYVDVVRVSNLLTKSPCAIVANPMSPTGNMERIMMSQAFKGEPDPIQKMYLSMKKHLEINPNHPIMINLLEKVKEEKVDDQTKETAIVLYEMSLVRSGFVLPKLDDFTSRVESVIRNNLGVDLKETAKVDVKPAPEPEKQEKKEEAEEVEEEGHDEL